MCMSDREANGMAVSRQSRLMVRHSCAKKVISAPCNRNKKNKKEIPK